MEFKALNVSYIGLSLDEAFRLKNQFNILRSSGQLKVEIKQSVSSWYPGNKAWIPGIGQLYGYFSFYSWHGINTYNKGHFSIHYFYKKFPASIIFCKTCQIRYHYQRYWFMAKEH